LLRHALAMVCEVSKRGTTVPELPCRIYHLSICFVFGVLLWQGTRPTAADSATLALIGESLRILGAYSIEKVVDERGFEPPASSLRTVGKIS